MVKPEDAAKGCGDVNDGFENKYVFRGFACVVDILALYYMITRDKMEKKFRAYPCARRTEKPAHHKKRGLKM